MSGTILRRRDRTARPPRVEHYSSAVNTLRSAHVMLHYDDDGLPALTAAPDTPHRRRLVRLAFLAPDIQRGIVEGRQSAGLTLTQLLKGPIPLDWSQQAARFPFAASPE